MDFPLPTIDPQQAATSVSNSSTISWVGNVVRVTESAPVTGVILAVGNNPLQSLLVVNSGSFPITMAASGTSNVSDGVQCVIPPNTGVVFYWDSVQSLWVPTHQAQFNPLAGSQIAVEKM